MAIQFADIEEAVRVDLDQTSSATISADDIFRYCREVYHELIHSKPDLQSVFNSTTGVITDLASELPVYATEFPTALDNRLHAIMAGVRARITKRYLTSPEQVARYKIENDEFYAEQGIKSRK